MHLIHLIPRQIHKEPLQLTDKRTTNSPEKLAKDLNRRFSEEGLQTAKSMCTDANSTGHWEITCIKAPMGHDFAAAGTAGEAEMTGVGEDARK